MTRPHLEPTRVQRFIMSLLAVSLLAMAIHFPFHESVYVRGPFGALGLIFAWVAAGAAFWSMIRIRVRQFALLLLLSVLVLAYWLYQLYEAVWGRYL